MTHTFNQSHFYFTDGTDVVRVTWEANRPGRSFSVTISHLIAETKEWQTIDKYMTQSAPSLNNSIRYIKLLTA